MLEAASLPAMGPIRARHCHSRQMAALSTVRCTERQRQGVSGAAAARLSGGAG
jgi:hypothetical protein